MSQPTDPKLIADQAKEIYRTGDFVPAADAFRAAAVAFEAGGDPVLAAEMKNNECVSLLRAKQFKAALEAVEGTPEVFTAAEDTRRLGTAYANRASVLEALKRPQEAIADYVLSAGWLEKAGEDGMRLQIMQLLSALYLRRGKLFNAVMALQSGLAGIKHPTAKQKFLKRILFIRM